MNFFDDYIERFRRRIEAARVDVDYLSAQDPLFAQNQPQRDRVIRQPMVEINNPVHDPPPAQDPRQRGRRGQQAEAGIGNPPAQDSTLAEAYLHIWSGTN